MAKHHPIQALEHALDTFDHEMDALRKDVTEGIHDAIFDEESLITRDDGSHVNPFSPGARYDLYFRNCSGEPVEDDDDDPAG